MANVSATIFSSSTTRTRGLGPSVSMRKQYSGKPRRPTPVCWAVKLKISAENARQVVLSPPAGAGAISFTIPQACAWGYHLEPALRALGPGATILHAPRELWGWGY